MEITLDGPMPTGVPLSLYDSVRIGSAENRGESFDLYIGINKEIAEKIKEFSIDLDDKDLQENTSDYARFGEGSYEEWYSKSRVPFVLVHKATGALAALIWFGPKPLGRKSLKHLSAEELKEESTVESGGWHAAAFRTYAPFRGTGIMRKFVETCSDVYVRLFPGAKLWTSNARANAASVGLSEKVGFRIDESLSDEKQVTMVR